MCWQLWQLSAAELRSAQNVLFPSRAHLFTYYNYFFFFLVISRPQPLRLCALVFLSVFWKHRANTHRDKCTQCKSLQWKNLCFFKPCICIHDSGFAVSRGCVFASLLCPSITSGHFIAGLTCDRHKQPHVHTREATTNLYSPTFTHYLLYLIFFLTFCTTTKLAFFIINSMYNSFPRYTHYFCSLLVLTHCKHKSIMMM